MKKLLIAIGIIIIAAFLIKKKDMTFRQSFMKTFYPLLMLKSKWAGNKKVVAENNNHAAPPVAFYQLKATRNDGSEMNFADFKGKKVMLVNTASDCGYTGQYDDLQELHKKYGEKLIILGFPANDFKEQEKGSDEEIAQFCKLNFGVTFPLMKKSSVIHGAAQNDVFNWLSDPTKNGWNDKAPAWNFTKYLVDENGVLINVFPHSVSPTSAEVVKHL